MPHGVNGIDYIAVPTKEFLETIDKEANSMIFPVLIHNTITVNAMAQFVNPHWELIGANRRKLDNPPTHVIVPKQWYAEGWLKRNHDKLFILAINEQVFNIYESIAVKYIGLSIDPIYEVNNIFIKLKLVK